MTRTPRQLFYTLLLVPLAAILGAVDFAQLGPAIGQPMPDFSAPDQNGEVRTLHSVLKRNGAVIVFFRSADW